MPMVSQPDTLPEAAVTTAVTLLRAGQWDEGFAAAAVEAAAGQVPGGELKLLLAIAKVRSGVAPVEVITADLVCGGNRRDLRRLLISPLIQQRALNDAVAVLGTVIAAAPPALDEVRQRSGLLARLQRWDEAIVDADACGLADPLDPDAQAKRLQYRLQGGRVAEAAVIAKGLEELPTDDRALTFMLLALIRGKDFASAAELVDRIDAGEVDDAGLAANMVHALACVGRFDEAIELGDRFIDWTVDGPLLRTHLGQAWMDGPHGAERFAKAIEHFEAGVAHAPDDLRLISSLGDLLLRTGKTERAIPYLKQAVEQQPKLAQIRALYARALKQTGRHAEAADEFATMIADAPDQGGRWQRYAAGALAQAGRKEEAADMFDAWVSTRREGLPDSFGPGLEALWDKIDKVKIPKARFDWAWSLRAPDAPETDRADWERRARWGHLADHYLLDWLECRDEQVEEAMYHFADELDVLERFCEEARARAPGKGVVFASGHVGAMYFGPLALELVGERSRWLASTPSVARTSYAQSLISTSDQTDTQVVRAFMQALKRDNIVVIVVDGAINLAAPRIEFAGQEITFSDFAARTAQRMGSPSAFVAPVWREDNHLGFMLEHLPMPEEDEGADEYALRWQEAYLGHLRKFLSGRPENLRLSGGIWRHIR